jgi:hypothetical protein
MSFRRKKRALLKCFRHQLELGLIPYRNREINSVTPAQIKVEVNRIYDNLPKPVMSINLNYLILVDR